MMLRNLDGNEKDEILSALSNCFRLQSYKYIGKKSIERRRKRKPNKKSGAIVISKLTDEEKAKRTNELLYEYPDKYGIKQATAYFDNLLKDKTEISTDSIKIETRTDAMMIAASIIYSGTDEFPYEVEFLGGTTETAVATISNVNIKRNN
jgi:hypothetical protein